MMIQKKYSRLLMLMIIIGIMINTTTCYYFNSDILPLRLKSVIRSQIGSLGYTVEETPIDDSIDPNGMGVGTVSKQWVVYIPEYDLKYHIWYATWRGGKIETYDDFRSDFSYVFLKYYIDCFQKEGGIAGVSLTRSSPANCKLTTIYSDEETLARRMAEADEFCKYVAKKCRFKFNLTWEVLKTCQLIDKDGASYPFDILVTFASTMDSSAKTLEEHLKIFKNGIADRERSLMLKLYKDISGIYPREEVDRIQQWCLSEGQLYDSEKNKYTDVFEIPGEHCIRLTELYKLLQLLHIPTRGDESAFSFSVEGHSYEFSYDYWEKVGDDLYCYYLDNGMKKYMMYFTFFPRDMERLLGISLETE